MSNVAMMPNWKKDGTAEDRFGELAVMARLQPERFARVLIIYEEDLPDDVSKTRWAGTPMTTREKLGLLHQAQFEVMQYARGLT